MYTKGYTMRSNSLNTKRRNFQLTELLTLASVLEILAKALPTRCLTNPLNTHIVKILILIEMRSNHLDLFRNLA